MKLTIVLWITIVVAGVFGIGFIFAPEMLMEPYLVETTEMAPEHVFLIQIYGGSSAFVGVVALVGLFFQSDREKRLLTYALISFMASHAILFVYGTLAGGISSLGWIMVGVTGGQALLYALSLTGKKA